MCLRASMSVCTCLRACVCVRVHLSVCMCKCVCLCASMSVCMHVCERHGCHAHVHVLLYLRVLDFSLQKSETSIVELENA